MLDFLDAATLFVSFFSGFLYVFIEIFKTPYLLSFLILGLAGFFFKKRHRF